MKLLKIAEVALNPPRLYRAVNRCVKKWHDSRLSVHVGASRRADENRKYFVADMDWYGYSGFDFAKVLPLNQELADSVQVQKVSREMIFSTMRNASAIRKVWDESGDYTKALYNGFNLWELSKVSISKELGYLPGGIISSDERCVIDQFYHWTVLCFNGVQRYLDKVLPHAVVVFQGGFFDSRVVAECAAVRGIRIIAIERSFIGDHALIDGLCGVIVNRHTLAVRGSTLYEVRSPAHDFDPIAFWDRSLMNKGTDHRTGGAAIDILNLPKGKKLVLVIGQVASDASITLDSTVYRSPAELIRDVLLVADAHSDWHVIARLHPKEAWHTDCRNAADGPGEYLWDNTLKDLEKLGIANRPNLTIVSGPEIHTYDLMRLADLGVTINSQAGLEMALLGKPIVTTGRCFYARNGFTWDVEHRELLPVALEKAIGVPHSVEQRQKLLDFCRYLFGHYLLPLDPQLAARRINRFQEIFGFPLCTAGGSGSSRKVDF